MHHHSNQITIRMKRALISEGVFKGSNLGLCQFTVMAEETLAARVRAR